MPSTLRLSATCEEVMRYGENPHQQAAFYQMRYSYTDNEKSPFFVGINRIRVNTAPIDHRFTIATTPNATTKYGLGF